MIMTQNWILILTHLHLLMKWDQNASIVAYTKHSTDSESEVVSLREKLQEKLSILCAQVNHCNSTVALLSAKSHVTSAISIIKSFNHKEIKLPHKTGPEPSNKNVTPQRQFFSTKNKCKRPTVQLVKPSTEEKDKICTSLLNSGPLTSIYGGCKGRLSKRTSSKLP